MKNQKGITLVALVVTIVVLLILAGTSIAMLSGDTGILSNATRSKAANIEGEVTEKMKMAFNAAKMQDISDFNINVNYERNIYKLADIILKELDSSATDEFSSTKKSITKGKYTVTCESTDNKTGKIKMTYKDETFDTTKTGKKNYDDIVMTVSVGADSLTLDTYNTNGTMQTAQ